MSPSVAVIVPAYNAAATLPACLAAIAAMTVAATETIVFVDGGTDTTEAIARAAGAQVLRHPGPPLGPAHGRNTAARAARAELLLFVDADVIVAPDALAHLLADLQAHGAVAAFGSYDDHPRSRRAASLYANLRHHHVHQHSARDATTFWSGLGLVDRAAFLVAGGFDAVLFAHPSIEDVELGMRLVAGGARIRLVPEAQGSHWKDWSLWRVWHTDVVRRAWPWARLLVERRVAGTDLNLSAPERRRALVAVALATLLLAGIAWPASLVAAAAVTVLYLVLNRGFFLFLARRLPAAAWLQAVWMHWCYHLYATATYAFAYVTAPRGNRRPAPDFVARDIA